MKPPIVRNRYRITALILSIALVLAPIQVTLAGDVPLGPSPVPVQSSLPDLGSTANAMISRADEYQIGRIMIHNLREENALLDDPETTEYLQAVGSRIGVEAQDGQTQLTYLPIKDASINASTLPGGFIVINTGLILLTETESQLAGVMAHETGHAVQRHLARALQAQGRASLATIAGLLAAVLIGAVGGGRGDAIPGVIAMSQGVAMQQEINFTRMEEAEADRVGIGYLAQAGFDPNGMTEFFSIMMRESGLSMDQIPKMLLDHPADAARIADARARVRAMPSYPRRPDSLSYPYIRERVRVIAGSQSAFDLRRYYEHMREVSPNDLSLVYGAALVEMKDSKPQAAVDLLQPLMERKQQLPLLVDIALAQAQLAAGHKDDAMNTFERGLAIAPRNVPLTVRYAEALLASNQPAKAHQLLLDLFNNVAPTPEQIKLTALAASAAGDTGDAYYYMSEFHIANGDLMLATTQLDLALAAPNLTNVQRKRFLARRDEIRGYLREQLSERSGRAPPPGG